MREFTGILDCVQKTVTREGLHAPYKGLQLALYELVLYQGCHSALYVCMSKILDSRKGLKMLEKVSKVCVPPVGLNYVTRCNNCQIASHDE